MSGFTSFIDWVSRRKRRPGAEMLLAGDSSGDSALAPPGADRANESAGTRRYCALVLDDEVLNLVAITRRLVKAVPDALVLTARSLAEARLYHRDFSFNLCILDVRLPDGSGIDFMFEVVEKNPLASVMIMTGEHLPEVRDQAEAFGVLTFMEKPVNLNAIASMAQSLCERFRNPAERGDTSFVASLSRLSPLDVIQLKCLNKASQAVDFVSQKHGSGRVYFRDGEIIHAQTEVAAGENA